MKVRFQHQKLILFFLATFLITSSAFTQKKINKKDFCFTDQLLLKSIEKDADLIKKLNEQDQQINYFKKNILPSPFYKGGGHINKTGGSTNFVIPVVVYVVHQNGIENITDVQIISQIDKLNTEFDDSGVQFCLATKEGASPLPGSISYPGIIRINSPLTNHLIIANDATLKALSPLPSDRYLRIWVVKDIDNNSGVLGYATFPGTVASSEGIVIRYDAFGDAATCDCSNLLQPNDEGKIMVHEVGHYLNLYHTFHNGCSGINASTCDLEGDRVCDTPPVEVNNSGCQVPGSINSCNETPDFPDLLDNHMDYTDDICRTSFTAGQETRMISAINLHRSTLVSTDNLLHTNVLCTGGLFAAFAASNNNPCSNQGVNFTATTVLGATYSWDFGDGTPTMTGNPVNHTYLTGGTNYNVTLTLDNGTNSVSESQEFYVSDCNPISSSQGNWYFHDKAGLDFSSGTPLADDAAWVNNTMSATGTGSVGEACANQSDASGNLLFYTDAVHVWDKNHTLINPGNDLFGSINAANGTMVLPNPGNSNEYYIFTSATAPTQNKGFRYSTVQVLGTVASITPTLNVPILAPAGYTTGDNGALLTGEGITAIASCNGYWIICNAEKSGARYLVIYELNSSGITFHSEYNTIDNGSYSLLEASPNGERLAKTTFSAGSGTSLYDFNKTAGTITSETQLNSDYSYGASFSPNSELLYITKSIGGLHQYDVTNLSPASTEVLIEYSFLLRGLQIGPDGKIYAANFNSQKLAVIHQPNVLSTIANPNACAFSFNGPHLNTLSSGFAIKSGWGLPNMLDANTASVYSNTFTYSPFGECLVYNFFADVCTSSYSWTFGDSSSGSTNTSTLQNPTHTFSEPGTYTVTLDAGGTIITETITIGLTVNVNGPTTVCLQNGALNNYSASGAPSGVIYNWSVTGGIIAGLNGLNNVDINWASLPGTVTLTTSEPNTGCITTIVTMVTDCSNDNWFFYNKAGLDFSSGTPVANDAAWVNNTITNVVIGTAGEACATQSDASGNLLFYTDAIHVWDENHTLINPGNDLFGHITTAQGTMILPNPGNSNEYYILTSSTLADPIPTQNKAFSFSKVQISGTAASMTSILNSPIIAPPGYLANGNGGILTGQGITAIASCNGYWIICNAEKFGTRYLVVYELSSSGITFHSEYNTIANDSYSVLEAAPNGERLSQGIFFASTGSIGTYLYDFNKTTGTITSETQLNSYSSYGLSFSPSSEILYTSGNAGLYQYDVIAANPSSTEVIVTPMSLMGLQAGSDAKIYATNAVITKLAVIHQPNVLSTIANPNACDFDVNGPNLNTPASGSAIIGNWSLPNMIDASTASVYSSTFTYSPLGGCLVYTFSSDICTSSFSWNFGDPSSGSANTSTLQNPTHTFSSSGTYTVTLNAGGTTITETITTNCNPTSTTQDNWFFYDKAGLDFSSGAPIANDDAWINNTITDSPGEACATQSDANGNLLFYTNAVNVWNENHVLINPGNDLFGNLSSAQGTMILPNPGNNNQYYIFTSSALTSPMQSLSYSKVQISGTTATMTSTINAPIIAPTDYLTGGNGGIITGQGITAIASCNGYWIICSGEKSGTRYLIVYELSSSGIAFHSDYNTNSNGSYSVLEASPDGERFTQGIFNGTTGTSLYDFDKITGTITSEILLNSYSSYGLSFSPNSKLLYTSGSLGLYQYDVTATNPPSTEVLVTPMNLKGLQTGPNGKIYAAVFNAMKLAVIHQPNVLSTSANPNACAFNVNGPNLNTPTSGSAIKSGPSLPNMIDANTASVYGNTLPDCNDCSAQPSFTYNFIDPCTINFTNTTPIPSGFNITGYLWNFGDPGSGIANTSTLPNPTHSFSGSGTYEICLTIYIENGSIGCSKNICKKITLKECKPGPCGVKPSFRYILDKKKPCTINFTDLSTAAMGYNVTGWQWTVNGVIVGALQNPSYTFPGDGTYLVCLRAIASNSSKSCKGERCIEVTLKGCNKKSYVAKEQVLKAWPNPSNGSYFLNININDLNQNNIRIYNVMGRLIPFTIGTKDGASFIQIKSKDKGIYLLKLQKDGETKQIKLIKN